MEKTEFIVTLDSLGEEAAPIVITQNEFMRRMKEMSRNGGNPMMAFYGEMPDSYSLVLNTAHPLVKGVLAAEEAECVGEIKPIAEEMKALDARKAELKKSHEGKKDDEVPVAEKEEINNLDRQIAELGERRTAVFARFAAGHDKVKQLIDLALLANNMLKGKDLADFVKRSISLMK
jgi:molecular chaperone HtpG